MEISKKPRMFYGVVFPGLKSSENSEHFQKKYKPHSLSISEINDSEIRG